MGDASPLDDALFILTLINSNREMADWHFPHFQCGALTEIGIVGLNHVVISCPILASIHHPGLLCSHIAAYIHVYQLPTTFKTYDVLS